MSTTTDERRSALSHLNDCVASCQACPLGRIRTRAVPGEGRIDADIMCIGEAPGYYEDQQGRPFVGAAGQFLDQLLGSIGFQRSDVFIANVIKCRPPQNRDPLPEEIAACSDWLSQQLEIVQPKVVVTLGRYSMQRFIPGASISKVHGQGRKVGERWVVPMYHPAAALHQGSLRRVIEDDFKKIPSFLDRALSEQQAKMEPVALASTPPQATQMKLF